MSSPSPTKRPTWTSRTCQCVELYTTSSRSTLPGKIVDSLYRFIGKTGGEIFHEMMLRQNVEHICKPGREVGTWATL